MLAGGEPAQVLALAAAAAAHVERHPFVTVRFQPCLDDNRDLEQHLLALARRFQNRAYREQTEPGFELLPVLTPPASTPPERIVAQVVRLRARLAEPRLALEEGAAAAVETALASAGLAELRRDVLPATATGPEAVLTAVGEALVVESALERLDGDPREALEPCRPHLVADALRGRLFPCVRAFALGRPSAPLVPAEGLGAAAVQPPAERCPECFATSTLAAAPSLAASGRRRRPRPRPCGWRSP